jgi:hypothetical protein
MSDTQVEEIPRMKISDFNPYGVVTSYGEGVGSISHGPRMLESDDLKKQIAKVFAAAGTAAHELPDKYDAVAAMEQLPELIRGLEELISCLREAHENAHPEGPMQDRRYGLAVDEAQDTLNAARADE